jgi:hypothetical protein
VARYFSQAHLYLKGTNWLTSVWPLMMRLSAAFTRRAAPVGADGAGVAAVMIGLAGEEELKEDRSARRSAGGPLGGKLGIAGCNAGVDESFQDNIEISNV